MSFILPFRRYKPFLTYSLYLADRGSRNIQFLRTCQKNYLRYFENLALSHVQRETDSSTARNEIEECVQSESDVFGTLKISLEGQRNLKLRKRVVMVKSEHLKKNESAGADTFGTLSEKEPIWYPEMNEEPKIDNDQSDDSVMVKNISKRYRCPKTYFREMKFLVKEKKLKEALDLFPDMRRNFVTPLYSQYTYMISACGKVGYTDMAFQLLRQMTERGYRPSPAVLTGLFNSCAECPFSEIGLKKTHLLKEKIETKNWLLTQLTYHSMIKAFGKCGDIQMAFQIVDEMAKADVKIDVVTYSFLLMSCIANKEAGFTYAIEVWRKMKAKKIAPNLFTCNLFLRAVRDCDVGPEDISCLLLQHWSSYSKRPYGFLTKEQLSTKEMQLLKHGNVIDLTKDNMSQQNKTSDELAAKNVSINSSQEDSEKSANLEELKINSASVLDKNINHVSNLLEARPVNGPEILELVNIREPCDRLALIGGMDGFLQFMAKMKVKPDIKTFTLLLENLPSDIESEKKLLALLDTHKVSPDIDFFNILIKKRNFRKDSEEARKVLYLINKYGLMPDIVTFGVLALGCHTFVQTQTFINNMKKYGFCPNIEIIGALQHNASKAMDFKYLQYLFNFMEEQEIKPDEKMLTQMEETLDTARKNIIDMEHGREVNKIYMQHNFSKLYKDFCLFYEQWLKKMNIELQEHPWTQYKTDIIVRAQVE